VDDLGKVPRLLNCSQEKRGKGQSTYRPVALPKKEKERTKSGGGKERISTPDKRKKGGGLFTTEKKRGKGTKAGLEKKSQTEERQLCLEDFAPTPLGPFKARKKLKEWRKKPRNASFLRGQQRTRWETSSRPCRGQKRKEKRGGRTSKTKGPEGQRCGLGHA